MTRTSKKDRETFFVDAWRRVEPKCPPGDLVDSERPDFLLSSDELRLGIELTELLVPTTEAMPPIAREQYQDQAISLAQSIHADAAGPPLDVAVYFGMGTPVTKQSVQAVADSIRIVVENHTPSDGVYEWRNDGLENVELSVVRIYRSSTYHDRTWHTWHTGFVPNAEVQWIQDRINKKASVAYSMPRGDVWLVIVNESSRGSSVAIFPEAVIKNAYSAPFGRVFLFNSSFRSSTELEISRTNP